jgi:Tfp pilus assembly protein PilE
MKYSKNAFTLVELMVMVIILMIVGAISFVKYSQYVRNGQDFKRVSDLAQIKMQLETYRKKHA